MILDSFGQDVRVGLRVLLKEKSCCFLAVLVLGLGLGGVTTQLTVVNAIALRGFSLAAAVLHNILFKVNALDPFIYFAAAGMLTIVAAASCFVPVRRATRVNPMVALCCE